MSLVFVALAAALGAACRYVVDYAVVARTGGHGPWGTFVVNLSGALAIGMLVGFVVRGSVSADLQVPLGTGFLGAYTTFSTWMFEIVRLAEQRAWRIATFHALGSLILGPLLTLGGYLVAGGT